MGLTILGGDPLTKDGRRKLKTRIATLFPGTRTIVTLPGIHATQRLDYLDALNRQRAERSFPELSRPEEEAELAGAVDLILEDHAILIRPDPTRMELSFQADEFLQEFVPKYTVRFLYVENRRVRQAVKRRGECWRVTPLPKTPSEMREMIVTSRIAIGGEPIYYYNKVLGTRFLTCEQFQRLANLSDDALRLHLIEIQDFSARVNPRGVPEVRLFMADSSLVARLADHDFSTLNACELRNVHGCLADGFHKAVSPEFRDDAPDDPAWRIAMGAALMGQQDGSVSEETLLGLSSEFFMQIQWLPGGRIEEGELIFDPIFDDRASGNDDLEVRRLHDENARAFIYNFVREYGNLEYVNIGRVVESLSRRPQLDGRRGVYIAEVKQRESDEEIVSIIRMQKWGVSERLDEGKSFLEAVIESEEYTEYVLDRRLGCRQLGMNLPARVTAKKIREHYSGKRSDCRGTMVWSPYFERDYIRGFATDKLPLERFRNDAYALQFARLLGEAAVPNMLVGRCTLGGQVLFDDGDEILVETDQRMPGQIVVADQTGTFVDFRRDLADVAAEYAEPIGRRLEYVESPGRFVEMYLESFERRFRDIQREYRHHRRAFDHLFKHHEQSEVGSFTHRWQEVLARLDRTDPGQLAAKIRSLLILGKPA